MFDALSKILGFIQTAFDFFLNMIESLIMAVTFLASSAGFTVAIVPLMPPIIGTALVIFTAIFVVKFLIGR